MKNILKKYWFIILVGLCLIGGIAYYTISLTSTGEFDTLKGKTVDGKDVVYSIGDTDVTADDFYVELYDLMGDNSVTDLFVRTLINQAIPTTDEMTTEAESQAEQIEANFTSNYGDSADAYLASTLAQYGYTSDELTTLLIDQQKYTQAISDYLNNEKSDVVAEFMAEKKPRTVSHILVSVADPENPTDEELAKLDEVKAALADGTSFEEVANQYSDDTTSATNYGSIGYIDTDSPLVEEFANVAFATEAGETSDWFTTEYGYHIVKVNATDLDTLETEADFQTALVAYDDTMTGTLFGNVINEKAKAFDITYSDADMEASIQEALGFGGTE